MGGCQQPHAAVCRPEKRTGIRLRRDLVHGDAVRPHGSEHHVDSRGLGTAGEDVRLLPPFQSLREQFAPLVHHADALLFSDLPNQIPQKGGFSPPGRAQNQNGAGSVRRPLGDSRKISRDTDAQGADLPDASHNAILADHLSAQTNAVSPGGGKIPLRCCRRRPWRIPAGGVDAVIQVFPADTAPQPAAFPAQNQLRRHS